MTTVPVSHRRQSPQHLSRTESHSTIHAGAAQPVDLDAVLADQCPMVVADAHRIRVLCP